MAVLRPRQPGFDRDQADPYRTLALVKRFDPSSRPERRSPRNGRRPVLGYGIAAAVGALLGLLFARAPGERASETNPRPFTSVASSMNPSSPLSSQQIDASRYAPPDPAPPAAPEGEENGRVFRATLQKPVREQRAELRPLPIRAAYVERPAFEVEYCSSVGETRFTPSGGNAEVMNSRVDATMMRIAVRLSTTRPVAGDPLVITVGFENAGDYSVQVRGVEESTGTGEFRPIAGALVPASVAPGARKQVLRYRISETPFEKEFAVVDRNGDTWTAALRLAPCGN